jgi:hypothetical protein
MGTRQRRQFYGFGYDTGGLLDIDSSILATPMTATTAEPKAKEAVAGI